MQEGKNDTYIIEEDAINLKLTDSMQIPREYNWMRNIALVLEKNIITKIKMYYWIQCISFQKCFQRVETIRFFCLKCD